MTLAAVLEMDMKEAKSYSKLRLFAFVKLGLEAHMRSVGAAIMTVMNKMITGALKQQASIKSDIGGDGGETG